MASGKILSNLERIVFTDTLWAKNFAKIALSGTVFDIQVFLRKIRKFKIDAIFGRKIFFLKLSQLLSSVTLWVKNFVEITLSSTVFEIQAFFCFSFLKKIQNFKMTATVPSKLKERGHGI